MIPKVINYCWFGGKQKPESVLKCITSWKKYCPDYEIKEWNEQNFDVSQNTFSEKAYEGKKWAFVTDYARLKIIYENGGLYFDTDVEIIRSFDDLLEYSGFVGFENSHDIATGLGFGAVAHHPFIKKMLESYDHLKFKSAGYTDIVCPKINSDALEQVGLQRNNSLQDLNGFMVFPTEYFCPLLFGERKPVITEKTYSIHHYDSSWQSKNEHLRSRIRHLIGEEFYDVNTKRIAKLLNLKK